MDLRYEFHRPIHRQFMGFGHPLQHIYARLSDVAGLVLIPKALRYMHEKSTIGERLNNNRRSGAKYGLKHGSLRLERSSISAYEC